jgi:plasmid replication initiation protein
MSLEKSPLLPDRHQQLDFFVADVFDSLPVKDDMASMGYPIFTLSKNKDLRTIKYEKGDVSICVSPSFEHGLPTIFDKDILLYCGSILMAEVNKGNIPAKTLRISVHDLLKATNRVINGDAYDRIEDGLKRLQGVSINTNIKTNGIKQAEGFHLIESYHFITSSYVKDRRVALQITLSDWFYYSIIGKEVLTISRDYFRLAKATERRLYEIARKHCGTQKEWSVMLETLYEKVGSTAPLRRFRFDIQEIAETNHLPDYTIEVLKDDKIIFKNRKFRGKEARCGDCDDLPPIKDETIQKAKNIVRMAGTGWDFYAILEEYTLALQGGYKPKNVNGAFIGFVKKKVKKRP